MCDFCTSRSGIRTHYRATPRLLHAVGPYGYGVLPLSATWAACPPCARLVDANDRRGLLRRAYRQFGARHRVHRDALSAVQAVFWQARTGVAA